MSIIKKTSIALAMAAAFGLAAPAMAVHLNPSSPYVVANTSVNATGDVVMGAAHTFSIALEADGTDHLLGRTDGFSIKLTLSPGVTFASAVTATTLVGGAPGWNNPTVISGGGAGDNFVIITMSQPATSSQHGLTEQPFLQLSTVTFTGATALQADGGAVTYSGEFVNPTNADVLATFNGTLVSSAYPLAVTYNASAGNQTGRIDVGTGKVGFSWYGNILADSTSPQAEFADGRITYSTIPGLLDATNGLSYYTTPASVTSLELTTTLTGTFGAAFSGAGGNIFIAESGSGIYCSGYSSGTNFDVAADGASATAADYTLADLNVTAVSTGGGDSWSRQVCFVANGDHVIDTTSVGVSTSSDASATSTGNLLPLLYNGSVAFVPVFNPANNPTAQSFLRVINPSSTDGTVTVLGTDDSGHTSTPLTFWLEAGHSMQINSDDLEAGNADKGLTGGLGDGAGKWRLDVTGEFNNMRVQSLNRNATNGTVTNLSGEVIDSTGLVNGVVDKGISHLSSSFGGGIP